MPLTKRLGQHTLRVLGRYVEPTGAVESSRRIPQSCVEDFSIPIQLLPAMPLMRDPAYRIDAASGTESIPWRSPAATQSNPGLWIPMEFHRVDWKNSNMTVLLLPVL